MSIGLIPNGNINQVADYSAALQNIPNQWFLYDSLNFIPKEFKTQAKIGIPIFDEVLSVLGDKNWDERAPSLRRSTRRVLNVDVPRLPVRESIVPNDVAGIISFVDWNKGDKITLETVMRLRAEKLARIKGALTYTAELARNQLIVDGSVYAPNGTLATSYGSTINFYNEFGITRTSISTPLATSNTDPSQYWETIIASIQDGLVSGSFYTDLVCICSASYFTALITNDYYVDNAKQNQMIGNSRLEKRLTAAGLPLDIRFRSIEINGITFIEHRGKKPDGTDFIPAGEARIFPLGVQDMFKAFYAPAKRFDSLNSPAIEQYVWEFVDIAGETQEISYVGESNFLHFCGRPQAIIRLTLT